MKIKKKRCSHCNLWLSVDNFYKDKQKEDGLYYLCKKCANKIGRASYKRNREKRLKYRKEYCKKNKKKVLECYKRYHRENKEKIRKHRRKYCKKLRISALEKIAGSKPICIKCGCNDLRFLEINHKNGGGTKEYKNIGGHKFYHDIINGERKTDDLNILCKACNSLHYLELKYGKLPYKIIWQRHSY